MTNKIAILLALAVALGRVFIAPRLVHVPSPEMTYEAFAHLICGGLIGIHLYDRTQKLCGYLGWGVAFWELGWFLVQKFW